MHVPALPSKLEHIRFLGAGGMGQVHLAFDRERACEVALKILAPTTGADGEEARFLFKQEYWAMASLRHPHLVSAFDYGDLPDGTPYLTMELVPGEDLSVDGPAAEGGVRAWLPGIAAALAFLHRQGYVHGDLKPENIRLREDGLPKLMDLGLLTRAGRPADAIRGSILYLAPEMIRHGAPDGRADLYSLGAVLYHVLAGRPPFEDDSSLGLLHAHLERRPVSLRELRPDLSAELAEAVMRLLAKDPAQRFNSASALLESLGLRGIEAGPAGLLGSPVVGRDEQREELRALIGSPTAARRWLVGETGAGKTRLLQETRAEAMLGGLAAVAVRGQGAEAPPYQALKAPIEAMIEGAIAADEDGLALVERLAPVLVKLVPDLAGRGPVFNVEPLPELEGAHERLRIQLAVAELALARYPRALWLVDDWDQLDPASRDLLQVLRRQGAARPWRWVLAAEAPPPDATGNVIHLPPLSEADGLAVARALLGQEALPGPVAERIVPLAGGQPGAIEAVLGHWLRTGALVAGQLGWSAGPEHLFDLPGGLRVAQDASFEALDGRTRAVAKAAAVLGTQGDLPWLAALAGDDEAAFFTALSRLEAANILAVDTTPTGSTFRFLRAAQAPMLVATLTETERRALHGRAARWMARRLEDDPRSPLAPLAGVLEVARHHLAGDTPRDAIPWAIAAVERALAMFELEAGEALTSAALVLPDLSEAERLPLEVFHANKLRYQGRTDEALTAYKEHDLLARLERSGSPLLVQETVSWSVLAYLKGQYDVAKPALERALAMAEAANLSLPFVRAHMFLGRTAFFRGDPSAARTHLAAAFERARGENIGTQLAATMGFYGYVLASTDADRALEGEGLLADAIQLCEKVGDPTEANEALNLQGNLFMSAGRFIEAREAFQRVMANADRYGMDMDVVMARLNLGEVMLQLGELEEAETAARQAQEGALRQGRKYTQGYALALEGAALVRMGRPGSGTERLQRGLALAREIGNRYLELNVLALWAPALVELGRFEDAGEALALARQLERQTQNMELSSRLDLAGTILAIYEAGMDPGAAARAEVSDRLHRLEAAARSGKGASLAQVLRWQAVWRMHLQEPAEAAQAAGEALVMARGRGVKGLEAELERLLGLALLAQGRPTEARPRFEASRALAARLGARPLELLNEHSLGGLDHDARRRRDAGRALKALNDLPPALRDAYDAVPERRAVLAAAEAPDAEVVGAKARDLLDWMAAIDRTEVLGDILELGVRALVQLTDAERGFLLLFDGIEVTHQTFYGMSSADSDEYSTSLAYEVLYRGEPIIMEDVQSDVTLGHRASIQALSLHAVVGVPLMVDGQAIGAMLADSRRVTPGFGEGLRDLVLPLADQVARAATRAQEREWQRKALAEHALLFDLALATAGKQRLEDFLSPVTAAALELTGAQQAYLLVGPALECKAAFYTGGRALPPDARELSQSACRWVYEHGEPLYLPDAQSSEHFQRQESVLALDLRAIHAVPVEHDGEQLGVLYLQSRHLGADDPATMRTLMRMGELIGAFLTAQSAIAT